MSTDAELLQRYARQHDERAFAELVQQHIGLVYAAAHRRSDDRAHLAEEITQRVFTDLARKSATLCHHPALTSWLYRSTRNAALAVTRSEVRRQRLNQTVAAMPDTSPPLEASVDWERLHPVLDEVMDELKERDREIMLLRFFAGLSFAAIARALRMYRRLRQSHQAPLESWLSQAERL
jgi:RNA polymerase sigma factor (sigma-70 family)